MSNLSTASREYANRPKDERFPSVAAMLASAELQKSQSAERVYTAKDLRIVATANESLRIASPKGEARFTHFSFGQLCASVGAPSAYLRSLPPAIAADALNHGLKSTPPATDFKLLLQAGTENGLATVPVMRSATTERYGRLWDADLYGNVSRQIMATDNKWTTPPTWSGEPAGAYRGDRDSFLILVNGGSIVTDPSISNNVSDREGGSAMYRGLMFRNSEVGAAAVTIEQILFRYICGNHMLWGAVIDKRFRRRHIGLNTLRDTVRNISRIARDWAQRIASQDDAIIRALITHEIAATRDGVIDELRGGLGFSKETAEASYDRCEATEAASPRSFWGVAQGVTRVSQEEGFQNDRFELDMLAAKVLARGASLVRV